MNFHKKPYAAKIFARFFHSLSIFNLIFALSLVVIAVAAASHAQTLAPNNTQISSSASTSAAAAAAATQTATPAAANVTELDVNGLKVLVKRRQGSQTVAAGLFIQGGARNITAENAGIETLMLATASEASANYPRAKMRDELARLSTNIGFNTELDYSALTMSATRPNFDKSWSIFTDVALHPSFTKDDVALIKERLLSSLRDETTTPDAYLEVLQERMAYAGHPYANRPNGTLESVARLTPEDLRAFHQKLMQTSRLVLIVVGDLDASEIRRKVESTLARLPRGDYKPQSAPPLNFTAPSIQITERALPTNYVQGVFTAPNLTSNDFYAMRVASVILRDRVFREVRERRNLSYAPSAFLGTQAANLGGIYVSAVDANQAVRVMLDVIADLQNEAVEPREISGVTGLFLTTYYLGQETNAAQVGELAQYEILGGGWRKASEFLTSVRAVTPDDVRRVARAYMRNIRFVVIGNPASIDQKIFTGGDANATKAAAGR